MLNSEKNLLFLIKTVPIVVIILFSIIATYFAIKENNLDYNQKMLNLKQELQHNAKKRIQEEVTRVYNSILFEKSTTTDQLKTSIKQRVYEAHAILSNIYEENKTKTKSEIQKMMKDALDAIRFNNNRGYFFLYEMNGTNILLPPKKSLEGTNFWNFKDAKGVQTIKAMSNIVQKDGEGFYSWYWYKPGDKNTQYKKIGFGKYFEPFDWFIGTGEYIKDFENDLKKEIIKKVDNIRYGKNGYIFLTDYDGVVLSHVKKEYIGKNRIALTDPNGFKIVEELIKTAKSGEGFIQYIGPIKPTTGEPSEKISYIKGIDEWRWAIGTGLYVDELTTQIEKLSNEIQKTHEKTIERIWIFSISLTVIFLLLSLVMSSLVKQIFYNYKKSVAKRDQQIAEQAKLVAMGEMIGNIAHQWRQPLSVISTASTGMKMQYEAEILDTKNIPKLCDTINDNAQYLSTTIDDFKNFIKGDRVIKKFKLTQNIESFLHLLEGTIKNNHIDIILDLDDTIKINGYPNELVQCFINIFNNAKDVLKEKTTQRLFFITTKYDENQNVVILLKDNAGGIPEDIIQRIFEPYFTTKHQSQGTGLGLSMTHNLVINGFGGDLKVKNRSYIYNEKEEAGAEFTIILKKEIEE